MNNIISLNKYFFYFFFFLILFIPLKYTYSQNFQKNTIQNKLDKNDFLEIDYKNAQLLDHSVYGFLVLSKNRWKNWVLRSIIIIMVFVSTLIILISTPKDHEINLIFSYAISGSLFTFSFWLTLSGWMLTRLDKNLYGFIFILVSILMYIIFYFILMKIKKTDINFSSLKENFKKIAKIKKEDPRLFPIIGLPGDWEKEDFLK